MKFPYIHKQLNEITEIPLKEYRNFEDIFHRVSFQKGEYWIHSGEKEQRVAIIQTGLFRMYYIGDNHEEYTKDFCRPGDFLAAYSSLLTQGPTFLNIQAMKDSETIVASYDKYLSLEKSNSCWEKLNKKIAEALFIKKERREKDLLLLSAQERYIGFMREYENISDLIPQYQIASFLGISPVSLSRIKNKKINIC